MNDTQNAPSYTSSHDKYDILHKQLYTFLSRIHTISIILENETQQFLLTKDLCKSWNLIFGQYIPYHYH